MHLGEQVIADVLADHVGGGQHVARDGEEALDLPGVRVEGHIAVCPGAFDHICHQAGGDRDARLVLFVGAAVAQVGDHRRDARRRIQPDGLDHDQELHQVVMDRRRGGLDDIHILPAGAAVQFDKDILVGELDDIPRTEFLLQIIGDLLCQYRGTRPGIQLDVPVHFDVAMHVNWV